MYFKYHRTKVCNSRFVAVMRCGESFSAGAGASFTLSQNEVSKTMHCHDLNTTGIIRAEMTLGSLHLEELLFRTQDSYMREANLFVFMNMSRTTTLRNWVI